MCCVCVCALCTTVARKVSAVEKQSGERRDRQKTRASVEKKRRPRRRQTDRHMLKQLFFLFLFAFVSNVCSPTVRPLIFFLSVDNLNGTTRRHRRRHGVLRWRSRHQATKLLCQWKQEENVEEEEEEDGAVSAWKNADDVFKTTA